MSSRSVSLAAVLVCSVAVAYLLGRNEALQTSLNEATLAQSSKLVASSTADALVPVSDNLETLLGEVVAIADGDTCTLLDTNKKQHKIRIQGIDAPEMGQDFSQEAKKYLASLVFRKTVRVEFRKRDKYGRIVGKIEVDHQDVGLLMVTHGLAWFYRQYANEMSESDREAYDTEERAARATKEGLWSISAPTPPWEYRHPTPAPKSPAVSEVQAVETAPSVSAKPKATQDCVVVGNRNSGIYHVPGCASYSKVAPHNREYFCTEVEAEKAGYRKARNCR